MSKAFGRDACDVTDEQQVNADERQLNALFERLKSV